jgi:hypothetical protein
MEVDAAAEPTPAAPRSSHRAGGGGGGTRPEPTATARPCVLASLPVRPHNDTPARSGDWVAGHGDDGGQPRTIKVKNS